MVSAGKQNLKTSAVSPDAVISATYTLNAGDLTVVAQVDNYHSDTDSSHYQFDLTYALTVSAPTTPPIYLNQPQA